MFVVVEANNGLEGLLEQGLLVGCLEFTLDLGDDFILQSWIAAHVHSVDAQTLVDRL